MKRTSIVKDGSLDTSPPIVVGSEAWFDWLRGLPSFNVVTPSGGFSVRALRHITDAWEAYRTVGGRRVRHPLGPHRAVTAAALADAERVLVAKVRSTLTAAEIGEALANALQPLAPVLTAEIDPEAALAALERAAQAAPDDAEALAALALARRLIAALRPSAPAPRVL